MVYLVRFLLEAPQCLLLLGLQLLESQGQLLLHPSWALMRAGIYYFINLGSIFFGGLIFLGFEEFSFL